MTELDEMETEEFGFHSDSEQDTDDEVGYSPGNLSQHSYDQSCRKPRMLESGITDNFLLCYLLMSLNLQANFVLMLNTQFWQGFQGIFLNQAKQMDKKLNLIKPAFSTVALLSAQHIKNLRKRCENCREIWPKLFSIPALFMFLQDWL